MAMFKFNAEMKNETTYTRDQQRHLGDEGSPLILTTLVPTCDPKSLLSVDRIDIWTLHYCQFGSLLLLFHAYLITFIATISHIFWIK